MEVNRVFFLQFCEFSAERAAIDVEIVRHLLTVQRDLEVVRPLPLRLYVEIACYSSI